jgi:flagellum-specific ATP synthase
MSTVVSPEQNAAAGRIKELLAVYEEAQDLINIGAYKPGSNPKVDWALKHINSVDAFLKQGIGENFRFEETVNQLLSLAPTL